MQRSPILWRQPFLCPGRCVSFAGRRACSRSTATGIDFPNSVGEFDVFTLITRPCQCRPVLTPRRRSHRVATRHKPIQEPIRISRRFQTRVFTVPCQQLVNSLRIALFCLLCSEGHTLPLLWLRSALQYRSFGIIKHVNQNADGVCALPAAASGVDAP